MHFHQWKRREFIILAATALLTPSSVFAQNAGRVYRLGILSGILRDTPQVAALYDELQRAGFVEGRNLVVAAGGYGLRTDEFSRHAAIIANSDVDAVYAGGDTAIRAAQAVIHTVPIVALTEDMVGAGLVQSLARPGGHTTGVSLLSGDLNGKRQEILFEAVPSARVAAALADVNMVAPAQLQILQDAARGRGVDLATYAVRIIEDILPAIDAAKAAGAAALNVLGSPLVSGGRGGRIANERTTALNLPAIFQWPEWADDGALIGYGPSRTGVFRQMARMLVKVLRGANPSDLPVEQPTRFELVINLRTAKAIGLEIPATLVLRADRVIE
jgi:putative ABC transport system substrate-binding protein